MIEVDFSVHIILIFTNHTVATNMARQVKLVSFSANKLNLRLVRASQYLSQFNLNVRYRSEKIHLVSDTLSRLLSSSAVDIDFSILDDLSINAFNVTLVEISEDFRKQLVDEYQMKSQ